jgi:Cof subfamily protein (haloacid dehalogenase superfamily)
MSFHWKLAAIDLDGTLLDANHQIPERNAEAVESLKTRGVICVIASGRMHESTLTFAQELGLDTPIISYNGAMVRDPKTDEIWHHLCVSAEPASRVIKFCQVNHYHLNYYLNNRLYIAERGKWANLYINQTKSHAEEIGDLTPLIGTSPTKMILITSPEETERLQSYFQNIFGETLYITRSNPEYLEFMNPHATKAAALEMVANRLGILRQDVIAFGDGGNDKPMIEWAGMGVAMAEAKASLREVANKIAPPMAEGGLGAFIEQLLGIAA